MPTTELVAFLDESKKPVRDRATGRVAERGDFYVVAAAVVLRGDIEPIRTQITSIETQLGYDLHYQQLRSSRRRIAAIRAVDQIADWDGYLFETAQPLSGRHHSEHHVRSKTLQLALTELSAGAGVARVVLETRSHPQHGFQQLDQKDNEVLQKLLTREQVPPGFRISHDDKSEPLLKLADLLAGARTDHLCGVSEVPYALAAHRIRGVATTFKRV